MSLNLDPPADPDGYWESLGVTNSPKLGVADKRPKPSKTPTDKAVTIKVIAGQLDKVATKGEQALVDSGMPIYQRGQSIVRPILTEVPASRGRTTLAAGLSQIGAAALTDRLCQAAEWERFDKRSADWVRIDPPSAVSVTILSRNGLWKFPRVAGVITTPTLRPDGSLLTADGYDAATRLFHAADAKLDVMAHIPEELRKDDAVAALKKLQRLLKNFPFVTPTDEAVAISAVITPVIRGAVSVAPMHAFRASTAGTGKTYLADVASAIATGRPCPVATVAKTEEETEKRLGGLLIAAHPIICLDNVNGELGGDLLCQAIERPIVQIRPLGTSEIIEIESRATIFATGNAMRVRGDMTRRAILSNLDAGLERPELREFDFDPVEQVLNNRAEYVAACLTIVLAHAKAGFPGARDLRLASFQDWSNFVRSALVGLGCPDPCDSMEQAREDDPELSELSELIEAWKAEFDVVMSFTTAELIDLVGQRLFSDEPGEPGQFKYPLMREIVLRVSESRQQGDSRKLASYLRSKEGRIVGGFMVRKMGMASGGVVRWSVFKKP